MEVNDTKVSQEELVHLVSSLSAVFSATAKILMIRTAKLGVMVDQKLMDDLQRFNDIHIDAMSTVKTKLGMN